MPCVAIRQRQRRGVTALCALKLRQTGDIATCALQERLRVEAPRRARGRSGLGGRYSLGLSALLLSAAAARGLGSGGGFGGGGGGGLGGGGARGGRSLWRRGNL